MPDAGEGNLAAALRGLRTSRGLGLNDTARRSGASPASLSAWETGSRRPRGPALIRLLVALGADERTKARLVRLADPQQIRIALADSPAAHVDVGTVLRVMRERRGVSQADLARRVGVSQAAVSKWELGEATPSVEAVHAVGFALGAMVEETLALASAAGRGGGGGGLPDEPEAALTRIWWPCPHALQEAAYLGWEVELERRFARDARWDIALAHTLARRTAWLLEEERYSEIAPVAKRAIRLATTRETRHYSIEAVASLADADRRFGRGHAQAAELAGVWEASLPDSQSRAWMLSQRGMSLVRMGRVAEGMERVEESAEVELRALGMDPKAWSYRAQILCQAHLEAGQPKQASALLDGRRERDFDPQILVRVEHANGRAAKESEMAWLRFYMATREIRTPLRRRRLADIERRQAQLTGGRPIPDTPVPDDPGAEDRFWSAVVRENGG